jgi:hypothetical protein
MQPWEARLLKELGAAELPVDVDFRAEVIPFGRQGPETTVSLVVEVPLRQLEHREDGNTRTFELRPTVLALLRDSAGAVIHKFSQDAPYRGALQVMEDARDGVYTMQRSFSAKPGKYELDLAVSDAFGSKAGARRIAVTVPAVNSGLALSALSLVRRFDTMPDGAAADPFAYRNTLVVPTLDHTILKKKVDAVRGFLVIYPDPASKERPKLELNLTSLGDPVAHVVTELPAARDAVIPYMASIPSASLRPGLYEMTATVTQGAAVARQKTSFAFEGPEPLGKDGPLAKLRPDIAVAPVENAARPSEEKLTGIIAVARQRALEYESTLPNFTCLQKTRRLVDANGRNKWQERDQIAELLRYVNHEEVRETVEIDGRRVESARATIPGLLSTGEFGVLLHTVFAPEAKAEFTWKGLVSLAGHTCHMFAFHIEKQHSSFAMKAGTGGEWSRYVACRGLVYVDPVTYGIRRVSIEAENVPPEYPVQASAIAVDYDLIQVGDHDYMLPVAAEISARTGKRHLVRNEITYGNYRRFGAESNVNFRE